MFLNFRVAALAFAVACLAPISVAARQAAPHTNSASNSASNSNVVNCRALEVHASTAPAVAFVIFHQQQKQDQPHLAELLKQNSGREASVQVGGAAWTKVTVFRLRTAFGRGMLVLPSSAAAMKDGELFRIRFLANRPADHPGN